MKILKLLVPIVAASLLFGCSQPGGGGSKGGDTENKAPVIDWILVDLIDYDESFLTMKGVSSNKLYSFAHLMTVSVTDPDGHDDIVDIRYTHNSDDVYEIKTANSNSFWLEEYEFYQAPGISSVNRDTRELTGWTMTVTDSAGNITTKDFDFVLPNLETPASGETHLYSSNKFTTPPAGGVATLNSPTINYTNKQTIPNNTITVRFSGVDERTKSVNLIFFDDSGAEVAQSAEISGADLTTLKADGELTASDHLDEIDYSPGKAFADITQFVWVSIDDKNSTKINGQTIPGWWRNKTVGEVRNFE